MVQRSSKTKSLVSPMTGSINSCFARQLSTLDGLTYVFFLVFYTPAGVGGEIGAANGSALLQSSDHPPLWQDKGYTFIK